MSFRVTSLAPGQSNDCPSAREATLKDMGKRGPASDHDKPQESINWLCAYFLKCTALVVPCVFVFELARGRVTADILPGHHIDVE